MGYFYEDFTQYERNYKTISVTNSSESWYNVAGSSSFCSNSAYINGQTRAVAGDDFATGGQTSLSFTHAYGSNGINLATFANGETSSTSDMIVFRAYVSEPDYVRKDGSGIVFYTSSSQNFNCLWMNNPQKYNNYVAYRKSQCIQTGAADWSTIRSMRLNVRSASTDAGYSNSNVVQYDDIFLARISNDSSSWAGLQNNWVKTELFAPRWHVKSDSGVKVLTTAKTYPSDTGTIRYNNKIWDNFILKAKMKGSDAGAMAIRFRASGLTATLESQNFYDYRIFTRGSNFVRKVINGAQVFQLNVGYNYVIDSWTWTKIEAIGPSIKIYRSNDDVTYTLLYDFYDDTLAKGYIEIGASQALCSFANIEIKSVGDDCNILLDNKPYYIREGTYTHEQPRAAKADLTVTGKVSWADLGPSKNQYKMTVFATKELNHIDKTSNSFTAKLYRNNLRDSYNKIGTDSLLDFYTPELEYKKVHIVNLTERIPEYGTGNIDDRSGESWETDVELSEGD